MSGAPIVAIRRLGSGDLGAARALNALFGRVFNDAASYAGAPPDDAYLTAVLGNPFAVALTAYFGETLAGGLVGYEMQKFEQARSEFYIYDLAVEASFRRRGVATALIGHMREIAAARGGWVVFVQADPGDDPAIRLYEKFGRRESVLHFDIAVPAAPR